MVLTDSERADMHSALIEYLAQRCGTNIAEQVSLAITSVAPSSTETETALERRWATLIRLANKNRELEAKLKREPDKAESSSSNSAYQVPDNVSCASLSGHRDTLTCLSFSNVDSLLFSGSEDGSVRVWDTDNYCLTRVVRGHVGNVSCLALEPHSEQLLASCSDDCTARIIDTATFEVKTSLIGDDPLCACCWFGESDHLSLLTGSRNGELRVWNVSQASVRWSIRTRCAILCIATSSPSQLSPVFAFAGKDEIIHIASFQEKREVQAVHVHDNAVTCLSFCNPQMECLICECFGDDEMKTYGRELRFKITNSIQIEPRNPRFVISGSRDKSIVLFDLATSRLLLRFADHQNWVRGITCTPNGTTIISVSDDGCCNVYDVSSKRRVKTLSAHDHFVTCVDLRRAGRPLLATGSADTTVRLWKFI